ncbi:unnamed protein product, partial [Mesorhabditis belari]|uniref:Uncharacterized protein n=1 Tax=Mesorhabditis belari TaxID=2138241 RepID=A0AAF3ECY5_9BILA
MRFYKSSFAVSKVKDAFPHPIARIPGYPARKSCILLVLYRYLKKNKIREEALRSAKLKGYFAANPRERDVLSTDKQLHTLKITCPALGDVPDYIVPKALRGVDYNAGQKVKRRNRGIKANRAQVCLIVQKL